MVGGILWKQVKIINKLFPDLLGVIVYSNSSVWPVFPFYTEYNIGSTAKISPPLVLWRRKAPYNTIGF